MVMWLCHYEITIMTVALRRALQLITIILCCSHFSAATTFRAPPRVDPVDPNVLLGLGDRLRLECPISGSSKIMYDWMKDGEDISTWDRFTSRNDHMKLRAVEPGDSGRYTCSGVNGFGKANFTFNVVVLEEKLPAGDRQLHAPTLTHVSPKSPVRVSRGKQVELECTAQGFPEPVISWNKDGVGLDHQGERLLVEALWTGTQSGVFSCMARNIIGTASANFTIDIAGRNVADVDQRDVLVEGTFNTTVHDGGNTTLQCTVTTEVMPEISWLKELPPVMAQNINNTLELLGKKFVVIKKTKAPTPIIGSGVSYNGGGGGSAVTKSFVFNLNIENAREEDQGYYVCLGINDSGYSYREVFLKVIAAPGYKGATGEEVFSEPKTSKTLFLVSISAGVVLIVLTVLVIVFRVRRVSSFKSSATTTITIASPPPILSKSDDPSALTPLNPDKQKNNNLLQQYTNSSTSNNNGYKPPQQTIVPASKHNTIHSYNSTLPLPPPVLPPDLVNQQDGLVYPPGKSRPLPHNGPPTTMSTGSVYSDHYVYPTEDTYLEPSYSDPYFQRNLSNNECGNESGVDLNYSEALHTPHPNTPNVLNPPLHHHYPHHPYSHGTPQHSSNSHMSTPIHSNSHHITPVHSNHSRNKNNSDFSYNDSTTNSKRSDSRTTASITNSPRDRLMGSRVGPSDQYYNSISSNGGDNDQDPDDYCSPVQNFNSSNFQQPPTSNGPKHSNLTTRSSEHSYARLTPTSPLPPPPYGITFPHSGGSQSQYVVHYNL